MKIFRMIMYSLCIASALALSLYGLNYYTNEQMIAKIQDNVFTTNQFSWLGFMQPWIEHYNNGISLQHQKLYEEAIAEYDKALESSIPWEDACWVRINKVLSMVAPIVPEAIDLTNIDDTINLLKDCQVILTEDYCATEDGEGHDEDAQQLYDDITKWIEELEEKKEELEKEKEEEEEKEKEEQEQKEKEQQDQNNGDQQDNQNGQNGDQQDNQNGQNGDQQDNQDGQNGDQQDNQNGQNGDQQDNQNGQNGDQQDNQNGQNGDQQDNQNGQDGDQQDNQNGQDGDQQDNQNGQDGDQQDNQNGQDGDQQNEQNGQDGNGDDQKDNQNGQGDDKKDSENGEGTQVVEQYYDEDGNPISAQEAHENELKNQFDSLQNQAFVDRIDNSDSELGSAAGVEEYW